MSEKKQVQPRPQHEVSKQNRAGDNDDGVNADELMGTTKSEYSSEQNDSMLADDVG